MIDKHRTFNERPVKVVKKADTPKRTVEDGITSHELCLLSLLVQRHPERARVFLERLGDAVRA
jgi:hypothetical protein